MAIWKSGAYWKSAMDHLQQKPDVLNRLEKFGVFKPDNRMIGEIISRCTVLTGDAAIEIDKFHHENIYSDVAWVASSALADLEDPFRGWRLGSHSALAFLRVDGNQPHLWARLVQSLGFQCLATEAARNQQALSTPESIMSMENRNLEYLTFIVSVCAASGILASMQCENCDTVSAMVFWGPKEELENVAVRLVEQFKHIDSTDLEHWLARGASFVVST
ncbi:hypothetical protein ACFPT7_05615 [Acidicapsa dinghuensis]|uniref:Uncharacterized protein n=1 Tax=Acidicapsa dinghuensis TaxID=2218256 RepID=A0ABW1EBR4_9BACT|nr:hypothetical protein [Acidicapsa dinghuensis]